MLVIDWAGFTWEAFATLATGVLAVGAAVYVGRKQAKISAKQTEILHSQTEIARLTLNKELFDQRARIFNFTLDLIGNALNGNVAQTDLIEFGQAKTTAGFLFGPMVTGVLADIERRVTELRNLWFDRKNATEARIAVLDPQILKAHGELREIAKSLEAAFSEMRIG